MACEDDDGAIDVARNERDVTSVRVRRERLCQKRITIIPNRDEPQIMSRSINSGSVTDDDEWFRFEDAQKCGITFTAGLPSISSNDRIPNAE
jgi:hypothetical protein